MKVRRNRLVFFLTALLIPLCIWGCSETSKPEDEDPNPPPPAGSGEVAPEEGVRDLFGNLFVYSIAGSSVVRTDGTFAVPGDTVRVRQLFIVASDAGRPVLLGFIEPGTEPIRIDAETTAKALLAIDPLFWTVGSEIRSPAIDAAGDAIPALRDFIRAQLSERRFDYLIESDELGVQRRSASMIRETLSATDIGPGSPASEADAAVNQPWFEAGGPSEDSPVVVNPHTIHYEIRVNDYLRDAFVTSLIAGPAPWTGVKTVGDPTRKMLSVPDGRYRLHVHTGVGSTWDDPNASGTQAARANLIEMAAWYLHEILGIETPPAWISDPDRFGLEERTGTRPLQEALERGDRAGFQRAFLSFLRENAEVLSPGLDRSMIGKASELFNARIDASSHLVGSRFLDDLFRSPAAEIQDVRIEGVDLRLIDPPNSIRTPESLIAHYSDGRVYLWWEDRANNEDGYSIERKEDGFFGEIAVLIEGATSYEDGQIELGHTYTYRVFALNQVTRSDPSEEYTLTIRDVGDNTPPGPVRDLSAGEIGHDWIELLWTAPGDDGWLGRAAEYDIRYLTSALDEINWGTTPPLIGEPRPAFVGMPERFIISGLIPDQSYWFGLVTVDEEGNRSELSNVVELRTSADDPNNGWGPGFEAPPEGNGVNGDIWALTHFQGDLIAAGNFTYAGGEPAAYIARWDGTRWHPLGMGLDGFGRALAVYDGDLIVGGFFRHAGETDARSIARWDGASWSPLGLGTDGAVFALGIFGEELIVGGNFADAGGIRAESIARWNGTRWDSLGAGVDNQVFVFHIYEGDLIVGGDFRWAGGVPGTREIARWNGASWSALSTGMDLDYVHALTTYQGDLIAGGQFYHAGGAEASNVARWDGTSWHPMDQGVDSWVRTATVYKGDLILGGQFWHAGGTVARFIARWNGAEWSPVGSGMNGLVRSLIMDEDRLIAGGGFSQAGGKPSRGIAIWRDPVR